jgi:hypothetical protein
MKTYALYTNSKIRMFLSTTDDSTLLANLLPGESVVESLPYTDPSMFMVENSTVIPLPPKPSLYHVFDYVNKRWEDRRSLEDAWLSARLQRNKLLSATDWTQMPDVSLQTKEQWAQYRQALRDVTNQTDPFNIVWPIPPSV